MKKTLKFLLIVFVYSILSAMLPMVMPHSQAYKDMLNADASPVSVVFLFICSAFICFTICFIAANSNWRGMKRVAGITFVVFMIISFMMQIEILLFGSAFPALTRVDTLLMMFSSLPPVVAGTMLSIKFFGNKEPVEKNGGQISVLTFAPRIAVNGLIYMVLYILFGYFVLWQFEDARIFYEYLGNTDSYSFVGALMLIPPFTYFFQYIRGVLFTLSLLPLFYMLWEKGRKKFIISVCLTCLTTPALLIVPNPLFPDTVRWAHFIEMLLSMLLFGIITGLILYIPGKRSLEAA